MKRNLRGEVAAVIAIGSSCCLLACGDPVHDQSVAALGPEVSGVPHGPLHRPGQPCVLCHSDSGGAPVFTLAGTIYREQGSKTPVADVTVAIVDSHNTIFKSTTNCAGNFFVRPEEYSPQYPIWISLRVTPPTGMVARDMDSPVYREGSCAGCHSDPIDSRSAGHVYVVDDPALDVIPSQVHCK